MAKKNGKVSAAQQQWNSTIAYTVNQSIIIAFIDSKQLKSTTDGIYMSDNMNIMVPIEKIRDTFDCALNIYSDKIVAQKGNNILELYSNSCEYTLNKEKKTAAEVIVKKGEQIFISSGVICNAFDYGFNFDLVLNQANIISSDPEFRAIPYRYSYVETGRVPEVRNQGNLGTCWAFASLTAIESTLLPKENYEFSADHMSMNNYFNLEQHSGGDYTMSMAYLLAWQGPVLERDDPYGDGITTDGLKAVKHVQEAQIIESKDYETIKKMIFKYGGVQSSFYASVLDDGIDNGKYYNESTYSYCYIGTEKPNHDIVIIGWDDNYPKENFNIKLEGNGAFLCRNSWGSNFGDEGNFYISYYDTNIGVHNIVYTKVENNNNYDNIYQSDLCGFVGQLGYEEETAYFANAYTSKEGETIKAVGFYATGVDTEYSIYICENFKDSSSLSKRSDPVVTGKFINSGYYTVPIEKPIDIKQGQKYAVIVRIYTPNAKRPVAVEFPSGEETSTVDLKDGEGYVSLKGIVWDNTEESNGCNVCLKVYTDDNTTRE